MNIRTKFLYVIAFITLFIPGVTVAQRVPNCVANLGGTADAANSNIIIANVSTYGEIRLYLSEHTFYTTNSQVKGTWSCSGPKINFSVGETTNPPVNSDGGNQDLVKTPVKTGTPPPSGATDFNLKVKINNPLKTDTLEGAIKLFMNAVLRIALPFIIVFFIWSGLSFVLARGNPEKIKTAKNMFWYTVIGALLILGAWTITNAIIGTVNSITG